MSDNRLRTLVAWWAGTIRSATVLLVTLAPGVTAQEWAARFPPHPDCQLRLQLQPDLPSTGSARTATLEIRPVLFGTNEPVRSAVINLSPAGSPRPTSRASLLSYDTTSVFVFDTLTSGTYVLSVRALGYSGRLDTVTVTAGAVATLRVPLATFHDGYRNRFNCRPRGFRRDGEHACVREGEEVDAQLIHARSLARPDQRKLFGLPAGDSTDVGVVADEFLCERAARAYGEERDPPRRVILIRIGRLYLVYDPFEPLEAGEWNITKIFDPTWRLLVALAG